MQGARPLRGELVAIDVIKFRSGHPPEQNFTQDKLKKLIAQIDERVEADLKELDRSDDQEDRWTGGGAHAEALAAKIEALKRRKHLWEAFPAPLLSRGLEGCAGGRVHRSTL